MSNQLSLFGTPKPAAAVAPSAVVRASAGSGKTFQLSSRYLKLLFAGESPERILATTFTRKAAGEIYSRIVERLAKAARDEKHCAALAAELAITGLTVPAVREQLRRLLTQQHRLALCTLDALAMAIVKGFGFELGLDTSWRIATEEEQQLVATQAVATVLEEYHTTDGVAAFQRLLGGNAPRAISSKAQRALAEIASLTGELTPALWQFPEPPVPPPEAELSALLNAVRAIELPLTKKGAPNKHWSDAVPALEQMLVEREWNDLVRSSLLQKVIEGEATFSKQPISDSVAETMRRLYAAARPALLLALRVQNEATGVFLCQVLESLRNLQEQRGIFGFGDLKQRIFQWKERGELEQIFYRLDCRYHHLLLDEFQDTSSAEWGLVEPFIAEILSKAGVEHSFFCVGDTKQAIYGWRGGRAEIFDSLTQRWPNLLEEQLVKSYRSSPVVIDAVNQLFIGLSQSRPGEGDEHVDPIVEQGVAIWSSRFVTHAAHPSYSGFVGVECVATDSEDDDDAPFIRAAVAKISELHRANPSLSIGVLVPKNRLVARMLFELGRQQPPILASGEGGNPLTDSAAVAVLIAALQLAEFPHDRVASFHLRNSALAAVVGVTSSERNALAAEALRHSEAVHAAISARGYLPLLASWFAALEPALPARDRRRCAQLLELAAEYDQRRSPRIADFIRYVQLHPVDDPSAAAVRVMTVHQSKGLEFDAVVLPFLHHLSQPDRGSIVIRPTPLADPSAISIYADKVVQGMEPQLQAAVEQRTVQDLVEDLCVLYVAVTRARRGLYCFIPADSAGEKGVKSGCSERSLAGLLRRGLLGSSAQPFASGEPNWFRAPLSQDDKAEPTSGGGSAVAGQSASEREPQKRERLSVSSPSGIRVNAQLQFDPRRVLGVGSDFGSAVHAAFAAIEWLTPEAARSVPQIVAPYLVKSAVRSVFEPRGPETVVFRELRFAVAVGGGILSGAFDRVHFNAKECSVAVFDFKTDAVTAELPSSRLLERYGSQLQGYREAAAQVFGVAPSAVQVSLVVLQTGELLQFSGRIT